MICCVIPAYKARATICDVVRGVLPYVDTVIVVDDACPQGSGALIESTFGMHPAVRVVKRDSNGGVGAATKVGLKEALDLQADVIIKLDADGQMDPAHIPNLVDSLEQNYNLALVKGNRFFDPLVVQRMPSNRLIGNSWLSLFVKFASGYWNILDPTNGYLAFNGNILRSISLERFADCYFFEISILCELGLKRAQIAELQMETLYGDARSSLSIPRAIFSFPPKLVRLFLRRLLLQYFLFDVNLGSLYIFFGTALTAGSVAFLLFEWIQTYVSGVPRTTGTVMLGVLPFLMGFQLLLNALLYDVQFSPRSLRELLPQKVAVQKRPLRSNAR